ncbi:MAG: ABC transporter ATP-binding protein [Gammaproteobacteria bacterium]|nr:ABC transporter ATP-binding protein [Gammaproteobacteria bacterium]
MNKPLVQIDNLSVHFKSQQQRVEAVNNISFNIMPGQNIALVGESGSGKSVTALSLLRLHDANITDYASGKIMFAGNDLLACAEADIRAVRGRDIAMIFQEPMTSLNPVFPVGQQIVESIMLHQAVDKTQARQRAVQLLDRVGIPDPQRQIDSFPHMLSGGQRQRVMIAMALACEPKLLIADEPTTALDVTIQKQILELLAEIQQEFNMSILLITHDLNLVRHYSEYVCVMRQGEIVEQKNTQDLFNNPQHEYTQQLLSAQPEPVGLRAETSGEPLLEANDIRVYFPVTKGFFKRKIDEVRAVDQVSLQLMPGETLGIVGESGSGKTTLGMSLLKLEQSTGEIYFSGHALHELPVSAIRPLRKEFQVVFQDPFSSLSPRMTVGQIIEEGLSLHYPGLTKQQRQQRIFKVLKEVGLDEAVVWRYPHEFSGGQRQRIAIARVVVLEPKLILLDEPTSALDVSVQKQVLQLLAKLQENYGMSYLFISHDLKVIRAISHRVMVMQQGRIVEQGLTEQVFNQPGHDYTKTLIEAAML